MDNIVIISMLYSMDQITKEDVFQYVCANKITDVNYKTIVAEECPELPINVVKQNKIKELSFICENKIINEFYSTCLMSKDINGNLKKDHFDCNDRDQIYIQGLSNKAALILNGTPTDGILDWKKTGEPVCYPFLPQACVQLGLDMFAHITDNKKRFEQLREYIQTKLTSTSEVNAIAWDITITAS